MYLQYEMGDQSFQRTIPLLETKQTSVLPFAVTSLGDYTCDERYYTKRKGVKECLLLYSVEGEGIIEYDGQQTILFPGQIMVMDCRNYQYYAANGKKWTFLWIHFNGKCAFDFVNILNEGGAVAINTNGRILFRNYFDKIVSCVSEFDLKKELEISVIMQQLLTILINLKKSEEFVIKYGNHRNELENSIAFMQKNFSEKISVEQLAQICHVSKCYYIKIFKAYTGQTPYEYLQNVRLQHSKLSLMENIKSVEEIAQESGFSESKNFIASFKVKVGMTPMQFRKQNRF